MLSCHLSTRARLTPLSDRQRTLRVAPTQSTSTSTRCGHAPTPEHNEVSLLTQIETYVKADVVEAAAKAAVTAKVVVNFMTSEDGVGVTDCDQR
jgi:hypothetical protein